MRSAHSRPKVAHVLKLVLGVMPYQRRRMMGAEPTLAGCSDASLSATGAAQPAPSGTTTAGPGRRSSRNAALTATRRRTTFRRALCTATIGSGSDRGQSWAAAVPGPADSRPAGRERTCISPAPAGFSAGKKELSMSASLPLFCSRSGFLSTRHPHPPSPCCRQRACCWPGGPASLCTSRASAPAGQCRAGGHAGERQLGSAAAEPVSKIEPSTRLPEPEDREVR